MGFSFYMAFSPAEEAAMAAYEGKRAWMGCRLSPFSAGIQLQPLPQCACDVLVLTDETPPQGHDPRLVAEQLREAARTLRCDHLLLDFQRPKEEAGAQILSAVLHAAPCPVCVSEAYAEGVACPVLVSPPPLWCDPLEGIRRWQGRRIWLEAATQQAMVTLSADTSTYTPAPVGDPLPFTDEKCFLSYRMERQGDRARFYLRRSPQQMAALLDHARDMGVSAAIGLHQQLSPWPPRGDVE